MIQYQILLNFFKNLNYAKTEYIFDDKTYVPNESPESPLEGLCRRFCIFGFIREKKCFSRRAKVSVGRNGTLQMQDLTKTMIQYQILLKFFMSYKMLFLEVYQLFVSQVDNWKLLSQLSTFLKISILRKLSTFSAIRPIYQTKAMNLL